MIATTIVNSSPGTIARPSIHRHSPLALKAASTMSASRMPIVIAS
jgi:hypothetical protein